MSAFHQTIKEILIEVEKFLTETIKKETLSKPSKEHKQQILDKIFKFRDDYPQLAPDKIPYDKEDKSKVLLGYLTVRKRWKHRLSYLDLGTTDESIRTGGSSNADDEDQYGDSNIPAVAAQDLTDTIRTGYLEKRQRKGGLFGGPKLQKRWCAIKNNVFYYYETAKEKKQHGAFYLTGYSVEDAPDIMDKKDKKELSFQLVCPAKRTYQFVAMSKDDYEEWKVAVIKGSLASGSKDNLLIDEGETYEDVEQGGDQTDDLIQEDIYDAAEASPPPSPKAPPKSSLPPPPVPSAAPKSPRLPPPPLPTEPACTEDEVYDDTGIEEEEYDDCQTEKPPVTRSQIPPPTPTRGLPQVPPSPSSQGKPLPSLPNTPSPISQKPLPSIPVPDVPKESKTEPDKKNGIAIPPDLDYENQYFGKWDCKADRSNELEFKRGDKVYIISKEFDDKSWWVGELNGKFGLVPKNYLTPAYELAR